MWDGIRPKTGFHLELSIDVVPSNMDSPNLIDILFYYQALSFIESTWSLTGRGRRPMKSQIIESLLPYAAACEIRMEWPPGIRTLLYNHCIPAWKVACFWGTSFDTILMQDKDIKMFFMIFWNLIAHSTILQILFWNMFQLNKILLESEN